MTERLTSDLGVHIKWRISGEETNSKFRVGGNQKRGGRVFKMREEERSPMVRGRYVRSASFVMVFKARFWE